MIQQLTPEEAINGWLDESFSLIQKVTLLDFTEYYLLIGASLPQDRDFELLFIKAWKVWTITLYALLPKQCPYLSENLMCNNC